MSSDVDKMLGHEAEGLREQIELIRGASPGFDRKRYLDGLQTPVFFGAAIQNFGVKELLDAFVENSPPPQPRATVDRTVSPDESNLSGFVFKIQANMDPAHRDRIAFLRVCSGTYTPGMRLYHTRLKREVRVGEAITFMAADRQHVEEAVAGDIIGLHNHGTINIGDSSPELFRRAVLRDPLRLKALNKGLDQLCEEGATQLFRPLTSNDLILGAVGPLQFDVAAFRLRDEYGVECTFEAVNIVTARWVNSADDKLLDEFRRKLSSSLAIDHTGRLVYLATTMVKLNLTRERWPAIEFLETREHSAKSSSGG
jgi:peptide chain release factor 3